MNFNVSVFLDELIIYDYILFGSTFVLFLLLVVLAIVLRRKMGLAVFLVFIAFLVLIITPTFGYIEMHNYLFKNSIEMTSQKRLSFTEALIVKGTLKNESKFDFKSCKITAMAYKVTGNEYKDYILKLKPIKKMSIVEEDIKKAQAIEFKIIVEPFTYSKDYNISVSGDCK